MSRYPARDFYEQLPRLLADGATLADLYQRMLAVPDLADPPEDPAERTRVLATTFAHWPAFAALRLHELVGGTEIAHDDDYVLALVAGLGGIRDPLKAHWLRADPDLRDGIFWRVFEVEGGGEVSLANNDKFSGPAAGWEPAVVELVADGTLDRTRVLRCCLEALTRDFSAYRAGWFSRTYLALAPTPAESAADQDLLRLALGSPIGATVGMAAKRFTAIQRAGLLEPEAFVAAAPSALLDSKAAATAVLKVLLARPDVEVADAVAVALGHPHPDVQRLAATALLDRDRADLIDTAVLAPSVAAALGPRPAAGRAGSASARGEATGTEGPDGAATGREMPAPTGADGADGVAATPPDGTGAGVHGPADPRPAVVPLVAWTAEDALERWAALLEIGPDADPWSTALEFEGALAWLVADPAAGRLLAPLHKRAAARAGSRARYPALMALAVIDPGAPFLAREQREEYRIATVDGVSRTEVFGVVDLPAEEEDHALPSLVTRLREVASLLAGAQPRLPLLATPTDSGGRIAPGALVDRLLARDGVPPLPTDLTQALLRLGPDGRDAAADRLAASGASGPAVAALGHALGRPGVDSLSSPWAEAAELSRVGRLPDVTVTWRDTTHTWTEGGRQRRVTWWWPRIAAAPEEQASGDRPALVPSTRSDRGRAFATDPGPLVLGELGLVTPSHTTPLTAVGVLIADEAAKEATPNGVDAVLAALGEHPGAWDATAAQALALGLSAARAEPRARAAELLAAAVPARLSAREFAEATRACAPACTPTRWATAFADAAAISPAAAGAVIDVLTALLPHLDRGLRGIGALVGTLLEESLRAARPVREAGLRDWLAGFRGSSAAARSARALLALG